MEEKGKVEGKMGRGEGGGQVGGTGSSNDRGSIRSAFVPGFVFLLCSFVFYDF